MSPKGKLVRVLAGARLKRAAVVAVHEFGGFQRLRVQYNEQRVAAGTKIQVLLSSDDMRTYTPIPALDGMLLLGWKHAGGPGARWMATVQTGDELRFVGPQRSLTLTAGPVILIGDETSVAVAAAYATERPGQIHTIIQTAAPADVRTASESVGLPQVGTVARGDTAATVEAVVAILARTPDSHVVLTGGADLVVAVRDGLRRAGVRNITTKTYWIPGKTGLD